MNKRTKTFGAALVLAGMAFAMPAQSAERELSADQLNIIVADVDVEFSSRWISGVTRYSGDGTAKTELSIGISDQGQWWLDGNRVCTQWTRLRRGRTSCVTIILDDNDTYRTSDGFTIRAL